MISICLFLFSSTSLIQFSTIVFKRLPKSSKRGWSRWPYGPSPILCDTVTIFVCINQSFCRCVLMHSNLHWKLVTCLHDGYCFCLSLDESYETINQCQCHIIIKYIEQHEWQVCNHIWCQSRGYSRQLLAQSVSRVQ